MASINSDRAVELVAGAIAKVAGDEGNHAITVVAANYAIDTLQALGNDLVAAAS